MKLWDKGYRLHPRIESYTAAEDVELDRALVPYDCTASAVHARVLEKAGVLGAEETARLVEVLGRLKLEAERGELTIRPDEEDGHTALENRLVAELGDLGKKIHTARSRNDQVVTALRLYMKDRLADVESGIETLVATLEKLCAAEGSVELPGYTHTRRAMPSSVGLWAGSFTESLADARRLLGAVRELIDQSPLGTGAGYGIPLLKIDRAFAARELGFARVQNNPLYVQNSRLRFEATVVAALVDVMGELNRIASDLILFTTDEFGFFALSREVCSGSSIMPHKLNPDALEILRARYHEVLAHEFQIRSTAGNLISGYHRDFQCSKRPLMRSFDVTIESLRVLDVVLGALRVDREACKRACTDEIYATARVYELVREGMPFRDAYRRVAAELLDRDA